MADCITSRSVRRLLHLQQYDTNTRIVFADYDGKELAWQAPPSALLVPFC